MVLGDFNNVLDRDDRIGSAVRDTELASFRRCVSVCGLDDMKSSGCFYT